MITLRCRGLGTWWVPRVFGTGISCVTSSVYKTPHLKPAPADTFLLPGSVTYLAIVLHMGHYCGFKHGDTVTIVSGRYMGCTGFVDSSVFQRTVDWPDEYEPGYHVVLDTGKVVTVRWDQLVRCT